MSKFINKLRWFIIRTNTRIIVMLLILFGLIFTLLGFRALYLDLSFRFYFIIPGIISFLCAMLILRQKIKTQKEMDDANKDSWRDAEYATKANDWILQNLVTHVNNGRFSELLITLNVSGLIISGELIGIEDYFKGIMTDYGFSMTSLGFVEAYIPVDNQSYPCYIHLKNAQFVSFDNLIPSDKGIWWRGRISKVDGYSLGSLFIDKKSK